MSGYHIGIDCTDSATLGMCTTYLGAVLLERLDLSLSSRPELVRLNPNVPWKTRGNGAVCLRLEGPPGKSKYIFNTASAAVEELSMFEDPQANPGLVVLEGEVPEKLVLFYRRALHEVLKTSEAKELARSTGALFRGWKDEKGLIGALAAVGADLSERTYELMVYRPGGERGPKEVDEASIVEAGRDHPHTFFNVSRNGKVMCIPRAPCPVLFGIRSTDPDEALSMASMVRAKNIERWVLWATNQHTDAHIETVKDIGSIRDHSSIALKATVSSKPEYHHGHLYFNVKDEKDTVRCGAYEPTKTFRKALSCLISGDIIRVYGGVRPADNDNPGVVNLEKVEVLYLAPHTGTKNPACPECGAKMESMGKGQPMRCKMCRHVDPDARKVSFDIDRTIRSGIIEPPEEAWRHLFKPSSLPPGGPDDMSTPSYGAGVPSH